MVGIGLLAVRIIQGFIYWGGGSRRFIYAPDKLNPDAPHWMAYKFQTAMPGALLGLEHIISFMLQLQHFWLLYAVCCNISGYYMLELSCLAQLSLLRGYF
ncbi:Putative terminal quinol oxidase, subunit DoxD [Salmonella enterica subsp. enterica serovar Inverness str. R8-3668]|uniref:Putative terminal quinol oxidase, subunit DoxD n=1 Tax=Salmonella enterica subsp. enterica serovar Inverness str. R8-3668 TaxID=913075 RepID=G5NM92_SALET|nr:Putative terminal quinol oxidase, subunit DoxD [Salmonella enterica subsp. enterica serovar Inverness str. R8-3668]